jgi:hypothetical protein
MMGKYAAGVKYVQYEGNDPAILDLAIKTGRIVSVTYGYSERYGGRVAHMTNLVHIDDKNACVLDNNFIGENQLEWMSRAEFLRRWKLGGNGWAVIILNPPPPPIPINNREVMIKTYKTSEEKRRKEKEYRLRLIAAGKCRDSCGNQLSPGSTRCSACLERVKATATRRKQKKKFMVMKYYGDCRCYCCGESRMPFLTIDHIHNDGARHRREIDANGSKATGDKFYTWLIINGYPYGFRVLCWNCNSGRHCNGGTCPHEEYRQQEQQYQSAA